MKNKVHILFFFALFSWCKLGAQTNNIDFELTPAGTYTSANAVSGWTVSSQTNSSAPTSTIWTPGSPEFSIVSTPIPSFPIIGNIQHSPLGGTHVARLNNSTANYTSTKLSCDYFVTSTNSIFQFAYAGVLEGFPMSSPWTEPYYLVRIKDQFGAILSCSSLTISPDAGWQSQGITFSISLSSYTPTILSHWTNWQVKNIDLSLYINSNITIEVISSDCIDGNHFGTLLFDANFPCTLPNINYCAGSTTASISAPLGHYPYSWYIGSLPFMFSTSPTVFLNNLPTPNANTTLTVHLNSNNPNCYYSLTYTLTPVPTNIYQIKSKPSCPGGTSGSATVIANAATSYTWINSTNSVVSTNSVANNLSPGIYTVNVTGCGNTSGTVNIPTSTITPNTILQPICGSSAILSYPGGSNYQWYNNSTAITASLGGTASSYTVNSPVGQPTYVVGYDATNGCRDSIITILTPTPLGSLAINLDKIICANSMTNSAVISLAYTPLAYAWKSFTVFSLGTTPNYSVTLSSGFSTSVITSSLVAGGTYSVNAWDGTCNYSSSFTVTPFNYTLTPSPSATLCQTNTSNNVIVTDVNHPSSLLNSQFTYSWIPSQFIQNGSSNSFHAYLTPSATPGTVSTIIYTVIVTPTLINCPLTKTLALTAINPLTPTISAIPQLCANASPYLITVNPTGGNFINATGSAIGSGSGILTPSLSNLGVNTFMYSNSIGTCVAYSSASYTVNALPNITISGNTLICNGQSITLLANGASTYTWGNSSLSPFVAVNPSITSSYSVTGTDTLTGCSNSKNIFVTVEPYPLLSIQGNTFLCPGETATLSANGAGTYSWSNGFSSQTIVVSPTITSTYSLVGTSGLASCSSTLVITIQVEPCNLTNILQRSSKETLIVYPNPSTGKFFIEVENISSISITDELGKIILDKSLQKDNFQLDLSKYQNGIYILKVVYNNQLKIIKLIKAE